MPFLKKNLFSILSWVLTLVLVAGIIIIAYGNKDAFVKTAPPITIEATVAPVSNPSITALSGSAPADSVNTNAIKRQITLITLIPEDRPNYDVTLYTVARGDSTFSIATENNVEPETILWANYETLEDSPDSLRVGQELNIPPVDGIYHQLKEADTIDSIAAEFEADPSDILHWPGNNVDLTNPVLNTGDWVMIPGGSREFIQWVIPIEASGDSGTSNISNSSCPGGAIGIGSFIWPTANHYLTGNDFWSGHLAIDIAANTGAAVYASDRSSINVGRCQSVFAGQLVGLSGNTGNSFGAHLHFEVRNNGAFQNPWRWLPAP